MLHKIALAWAMAAAAFVASARAADTPDPFAPLAFLAGSCWDGTFGEAKAVDRHCFRWVFEGKILRDRHRVTAGTAGRPSATDYRGESIYAVDPKTHRLAFRYVNSDGDVIDGGAQPSSSAIVFLSALQAKTGAIHFRGTWAKLGSDTYRVTNERLSNGKWVQMSTVEMKRADPAAAEPDFP